MARVRHPWLAILIAAGVAIVAYGAWSNWGPRKTPPGQPPLTQLTAANLVSFEAQFNAEANRTRLLLLLSPT